MPRPEKAAPANGPAGEATQDVTRIVLIEPDPFLREMIEAGLRLYDPSIVLLQAEDPEKARLWLRRYPISLVLMEVHFPVESGAMRGTEMILRLQEHLPEVPVVLLAEGPVEDYLGFKNVSSVVPKPPDMDFLLRTVTQVIQEHRESFLRGISLESFLQILELERKTCTLKVRSGGKRGLLYLRDGAPLDAVAGAIQGKDAAFAMLSWPDCSIKLIEKCDAEPKIEESLSSLLMEFCVQKDHGLL